MLEFLETPRFNEGISYGSAGGPGFNTTVFTGHGGAEQRGVNWEVSKGKWNVAQGVRDEDDMKIIRAFFFAVRGKAVGFRYKDWNDYQFTDQVPIGEVDGVNDTFLLTNTYEAGALSYTRRLFKPVEDTLVVKVDDVEVPIGGAPDEVDIDFTTGTLVFGASVIPTMGQDVTVSGEFDCAVRFDTDDLIASADSFKTQSWTSIPLVELFLSDD